MINRHGADWDARSLSNIDEDSSQESALVNEDQSHQEVPSDDESEEETPVSVRQSK